MLHPRRVVGKKKVFWVALAVFDEKLTQDESYKAIQKHKKIFARR
jgi:hypothetical protein